MASLGNPVLTLSGTIRRVRDEVIPSREAGQAESGRRYDARQGYTLRHFAVDTGLGGVDEDGGIADVTFRLDVDIAGGLHLVVGEVVTLHVRPYLGWSDAGSRPVRVQRFALTAVVGANALTTV